MKKVFTCILILFGIHFGYGQDLPCKSEHLKEDDNGNLINTGVCKERYREDSNGSKHGKYISYFSNGEKEIVTTYNHGKLEGKYVSYFSHGEKRIEANYNSGKLEGDYYEKKCLRLFLELICEVTKAKMKNNQYHGGYLLTRNNTVREEGTYLNGIKNGQWFEIGQDDGIGAKGEYKQGKRIGIWENLKADEIEGRNDSLCS